MNPNSKITASHLSRKAVLYIRQSSMRQVQLNVESTRRQYALKDSLIQKGWGPELIEVIDEDLGISGKFSEDRSGFQKLIGDIANGIVGVVACIEASRLSRNSTDWARIIDFCAMTDTLIMDEDMAYNPLDPNDRLLLGVKGSITEMELYTIRQRLWGGKVNKIRRGEYRFQLPIGYAYDPFGKIVFDPSLDVQAAVRKLFHTFTATGSICQTVKYFARHGLAFPSNRTSGVSKGQTEWQALTINRARFILKHPFYCGRYVFGRSHLRVMPGRNNYVTLDEGEWLANIPDHHPAYISEKEFQSNQKRIAQNSVRPYDDAPTSARNGAALLQGIAYCGRCGRRMTVKYETIGKQAVKSAYPIYICEGDRNAPERRQCMRVNGSVVDDRISALLGARLNDEAVKEAIAIKAELQSRWEGTEKMLLLRL